MLPAMRRLSDGIARLERGALRVLIATVAALVLGNLVARATGAAVAWADELSVYAMILSGFVGASLMFRMRRDPAVLLLHEAVPPRVVAALRATVSAVALAFALLLGWTCWLWFDPAALVRAGFDVTVFEAATFNFIYTERTPVMGLPAVWFFAVMPWFAATLAVHALTNLAEDAGLLPPAPPHPGLASGPAEGRP